MIRITTHQGFGDNIYARPYVKALSDKHGGCAIETPFPELYDHVFGAEFIKPTYSLLPTQKLNVENTKEEIWTTRTKFRKSLTLFSSKMRSGLSITEGLDEFIKPDPFWFSLYPRNEWKGSAWELVKDLPRPLCIVKLPSLRNGFNIPSRNPLMKYFAVFIKANPQYYYLNITQDNENEWLDGEMPYGIGKSISVDLHTLIGIVFEADMVLTAPGFMVPLAISLYTNCFTIFGGFHSPRMILDKRMGLDRFRYIAPANPCNCFKKNHDCNKEIDERFLKDLHITDEADIDCGEGS